MSDDIGPQGLLDHVESVLAQARDYLASDAGKANLAREILEPMTDEAFERAYQHRLEVGTYPYRVYKLSQLPPLPPDIQRMVGMHVRCGDVLTLTVEVEGFERRQSHVHITEAKVLTEEYLRERVAQMMATAAPAKPVVGRPRYRMRRKDGALLAGVWETDPLTDAYVRVDVPGADETTVVKHIFGWEVQTHGMSAVSISNTSTGYVYNSTSNTKAFDPPPSVPVTAGTGCQVGGDIPDMVADGVIEPVKPTAVVEEFDAIRKRMEEIRALEGRQAPA